MTPLGFHDGTGDLFHVNVSAFPGGKSTRDYASKWLASGLPYPEYIAKLGDMLARHYDQVIVANPLCVERDRGMDITAVLQLIDAGLLPEPAVIYKAHLDLAARFKRTIFYVGMVEPTQFLRFKQLGHLSGQLSLNTSILKAMVELYRVPKAELCIDSYAARMMGTEAMVECRMFNGVGRMTWGCEPVCRKADYNKCSPRPKVFVLDHDRHAYAGEEFVQPTDATEYIVAVTLGDREKITARVAELQKEPGVTVAELARED